MRRHKGTPKMSYEPEADVLRMEISNRPIECATEFGNVIVHFGPDNTPVYVEFLGASKLIKEMASAVRSPRKAYA